MDKMPRTGDCRPIDVSVDDVEDIPVFELVDGKMRPCADLTEGERYGLRVAVALDRAKKAAERRR